jgi:CheY-like chemotaxis protein
MDLSRIESGHTPITLKTTPLIDLMGELLPLAERQAAPMHVRIDAGLLNSWPTVKADRDLLKQALLYLISHAVQHSPRYGQVALTFTVRGSQVDLRVTDQGPSLSDAQLARLFEPFVAPAAPGPESTASPDMRLAVAHQCIEAMGGHLTASRLPCGGTALQITLDTASADELAPLGATQTTIDPTEQIQVDHGIQGRLLYVEDNPSNVLLVRECLSLRPGVELVIATNMQEGLQALRQSRFDMALLDLQLPDGDGYTVLRRLREMRGPHVPCVALTANAMLNERNRALEAGFDGFWTKPLNLPEFLAGLDRTLCKEPTERLAGR